MNLAPLSTGIFITEFDSESGLSNPTKIQAWLESNTGILSARLADDLTGALTSEQESIFTLMYLGHYYTKSAQSASAGVGEGVSWITIREGDSTVTRTNKNEVAKTYLSMKRQVTEELDKLIAAYHLKYATAQQVAGDDGSDYSYNFRS